MDNALEVIIDGLKDDLHGLRTFAETSEDSTQRSLHSVSSMLNTIVDRLGALEGSGEKLGSARGPCRGPNRLLRSA